MRGVRKGSRRNPALEIQEKILRQMLRQKKERMEEIRGKQVEADDG